jgi:hypothetical protein
MTSAITKKPVTPSAYSTDLRAKATDYETADNNRREAKVALDQGIAAEKETQKAYDDAVAKCRENILKQIADEPFPLPADSASTAAGGTAADGTTPEAPASGGNAG